MAAVVVVVAAAAAAAETAINDRRTRAREGGKGKTDKAAFSPDSGLLS